jgi:nicotinate-nucleotide--dimethylbenzimidazole phosphoribosyltransferase
MNPPPQRSLIAPTSNPRLERALLDKLARRAERVGSLGELEPLAVRIGLMQNSLKPRFEHPQLVVAAADHGLAVEGLPEPFQMSTQTLVQQLLQGRLPLNVLARLQRMPVTLVDAGIAENLPAHDGLLRRKIAFGTRNARLSAAMTTEQAHAAIRAGMEIADSLPGNVVLCAGIGVGSAESASLILSRLTDTPVRELMASGPHMDADRFALLMGIAQGAQARHREVSDPVDVLAAFGGFEIAMLAGLMLVAAGRRHLLMIDGMAAMAALMIASRLAPPVTDYAVFCRSGQHQGLDHALALFRASALLELGMECTDGTGAALAWSLVHSAAALLTDVPEGEEPGPTLPQGLDDGFPADA